MLYTLSSPSFSTILINQFGLANVTEPTYFREIIWLQIIWIFVNVFFFI